MYSESSLAVAIIYFEKFDQTVECIESVCKANCNVYVLNNNSSNKNFRKLKNIFNKRRNIEFINSPVNLGPSKGRNLLVEKIHEEWILFLDNDITVVTSNWLPILYNYIHNYTGFDVFIPKLYNVHEKKYLHFHTYSLEKRLIQSDYVCDNLTNCFPGGAACVKKGFFHNLGGYSEEITVLEDFEFSIRALSNGSPIKGMLIDDITLFHDHRYSGNLNDQFAAKVRYKADQFYNAEKYIQEKYNVIYHSGWKPWVDDQLKLMVDKSFLKKIKEYAISFLRGSMKI